MSFWCPCIVFGKNKQRLRNLKTHGTPLPGGGDCCDGDCCFYCGLGLFGLGWVLQVCLDVDKMHIHGPSNLPASAQVGSRGDVRDRYNIRGGTCGDCCSSWCCAPCALTQERREIELEEYSF